jgi:putative acetyltransferase
MTLMTSGPAPGNISIVPVTEYDLEALNDLVNDPEISRYLELIPPVPFETTGAFWKYGLERGVLLWSIKNREEIIGCSGLLPERPGTKLSHTTAFFLYIKPEYWGRGIGKRVIQHLEDEARERGYLRMECLVAATNLRAIRLYENLGYEREGSKKKAFWDDGRFTDLIMMGKVFGSG